MPADDFPALPRFEKVQFVKVEPRTLLQMIDLTAFAVSSDETRYIDAAGEVGEILLQVVAP